MLIGAMSENQVQGALEQRGRLIETDISRRNNV
jgi:hypothetical protein